MSLAPTSRVSGFSRHGASGLSIEWMLEFLWADGASHGSPKATFSPSNPRLAPSAH